MAWEVIVSFNSNDPLKRPTKKPAKPAPQLNFPSLIFFQIMHNYLLLPPLLTWLLPHCSTLALATFNFQFVTSIFHSTSIHHPSPTQSTIPSSIHHPSPIQSTIPSSIHHPSPTQSILPLSCQIHTSPNPLNHLQVSQPTIH